ncbi:MAG TPA: exodeoxyribonuclease VII large subunit [bacterium]|nr:exodeoxyribonuclease VII large subunit [bacterium]
MEDTLFTAIEQKADDPQVYSVSALTEEIKLLLETTFGEVWVEGEVSNFRISPSGHAYFRLKDEKAILECVIWRTYLAGRKDLLQDGLMVRILGELSVYPPRGGYQMVARLVRPAGKGALQERFERLKATLMAEGLFDESRKKPIPPLPRCIAVVTSPGGAAIQDFLKILDSRFPHFRVVIAPARVQGIEAPGEIAQALADLNRWTVPDVIVVTRGGGSLEDLWAFNEEVVARAIFASEIPVISAVGHEIDFTISDFVADLRLPTPTAAAEYLARGGSDLLRELQLLSDQCIQLTLSRLESLREEIAGWQESLLRCSPVASVNVLRQRLDDLVSHLVTQGMRRLETRRVRLQHEAERLMHTSKTALDGRRHAFLLLQEGIKAMDPAAVLRRGYSITCVEETGEVIVCAAQVSEGTLLSTRLREGSLHSRVVPREKIQEES